MPPVPAPAVSIGWNGVLAAVEKAHTSSNLCPCPARSTAKQSLGNKLVSERSGTLLTDKDGTQYFVMGKVRIKVSEHFAQDGKSLDSLLEDVIQHAAAAS